MEKFMIVVTWFDDTTRTLIADGRENLDNAIESLKGDKHLKKATVFKTTPVYEIGGDAES